METSGDGEGQKPGMLQSMGSPRVGHDWVIVWQQLDLIWACILKELPGNSYMHPDWETLIQSIREAAKNEHLRTEAFKVLTWEMIKGGMLSYISSVQLFATLWTGSPPGSSVHGILRARGQGVSCHALLQGIFPTWRINLWLLCLLHWQACSLPLVPLGKP